MIERALRGLGLMDKAGYRPDDQPRGAGSTGGSVLEGFYEQRTPILGERVTVDTALGVSTVYACIRILAETVGSTPILTYREEGNGESRRRAKTTPTWRLLHEQPNPGSSPVDLWTLIGTWMVGWGDAFLGKQFAKNGEVRALWPIHPADVEVGLVNGLKRYRVRRDDGTRTEHSDDEIIHVMGQSFDGLRGASPITIARGEIAVSMAAQRYAGAVYTNAAVPRGVLQTDNELTDDAQVRLRADWNRLYGGTANAGKVAILEEGLEFKAISMPMRDVQFVEQQQLSVQTTARIFRVPLSLIQADSPGGLTYRTAETENLQFLIHGVRPWYVRIEQALNRDTDLFPMGPVEYAEFLPAALLSVATNERFSAYQIATGNKPWMRPSEVRAAENLPEDATIDDVQPAPPAPSTAAAPAAPSDAAPADTPA